MFVGVWPRPSVRLNLLKVWDFSRWNWKTLSCIHNECSLALATNMCYLDTIHLATNTCYLSTIPRPLPSTHVYCLTLSSSAIWGFGFFSVHWHHFFLRKKGKVLLPPFPLAHIQLHHHIVPCHPSSFSFALMWQLESFLLYDKIQTQSN